MSTLKLGWARREISTNEPVSVPGQMHIRVSKGIMDPLYVTALCVDGGEGQDKVVFLSCDIVTVWQAVLEDLQALLAKERPDIPWETVVLNVTHTHTSIDLTTTPEKTPDGVSIYPGEKSRAFFCRQAVDAIAEAWDSRAEGGIAYGYGYAVVAHSRRTVYFKEERLAQLAEKPRDFMTPAGYAVMYGKTDDPYFSHYEAGADHFLNLMFTFDKNEKLTGIIVNVPCPSQVGGGLSVLTSDYWAEVRQLVAEEYGEDVFVLPQCAAAGDLSPRPLHYRKAQARRLSLKYGKPYDLSQVKVGTEYELIHIKAQRMDIAEQILLGIKDVYSWAKKDIRTDVPVRHKLTTMALERRRMTDEEEAWCKENLELLKDMEPKPEDYTPEEYRVKYSRYRSMVGRNTRGLQRCEDVKQNPTLDMDSHTIQIGDVAFATIRFELFQDFMHRLQARSPFQQTFVVQLAGAAGGNYLATKRAAEAKGYSASMFCNMVSADGGQQWVENTLEILNHMKEEE